MEGYGDLYYTDNMFCILGNSLEIQLQVGVLGPAPGFMVRQCYPSNDQRGRTVGPTLHLDQELNQRLVGRHCDSS